MSDYTRLKALAEAALSPDSHIDSETWGSIADPTTVIGLIAEVESIEDSYGVATQERMMAESERDAARADVERLTRERDALRAKLDRAEKAEAEAMCAVGDVAMLRERIERDLRDQGVIGPIESMRPLDNLRATVARVRAIATRARVRAIAIRDYDAARDMGRDILAILDGTEGS